MFAAATIAAGTGVAVDPGSPAPQRQAQAIQIHSAVPAPPAQVGLTSQDRALLLRVGVDDDPTAVVAVGAGAPAGADPDRVP